MRNELLPFLVFHGLHNMAVRTEDVYVNGAHLERDIGKT